MESLILKQAKEFFGEKAKDFETDEALLFAYLCQVTREYTDIAYKEGSLNDGVAATLEAVEENLLGE